MTDYKELYLKMVRATESAIRLLIAAQQECEEAYISSRGTKRDQKIIPILQELEQ